jgi:monoamine oxidase
MIDILIIGAGAAGVAAGLRLARAPFEVLIVEAAARSGGRAHSVRLVGDSFDLGCGWLHSARRNGWAKLAEEQGEKIDHTLPAWRSQFADLGFSRADQKAAWDAFAAFETRLREQPPASDRAADAMEKGNVWNCYLEALSGFMNGAELEQLSVTDFLAYEDNASDENWRLPGGYGAFIATQAEDLPIRYDTPIEEIDRSGPVLKARGPRGEIEAKVIILTVSTEVLARETLRFTPPLPDKVEAAAWLPLGLANKAFFGLDRPEPFEPNTQLLGNPKDSNTGAYYLRPFGHRTIECFFGGAGARALEAEGKGAALDFAISQLVSLLGSDMRKRLTPLAETRWGQEPLIMGSYSHALPGHADARAALAASVENRIFFAGEACSATDFSTAHGAFETGTATADAATNSLDRKDL